MEKVALKEIAFGGVTVMMPEIWNVETEMYVEPDGRECAMLDITATEGDPRAIIMSYGPMPEGSDALMEAGGTYDELMGDSESSSEDPICEYDFLGRTAYGFEFETEDELTCNFICTEVEADGVCKLLTLLTTAPAYEDIDDLLDLVEQSIVLK